MTLYGYLFAKPGSAYLIAYGFIFGGSFVFWHAWSSLKKVNGERDY